MQLASLKNELIYFPLMLRSLPSIRKSISITSEKLQGKDLEYPSPFRLVFGYVVEQQSATFCVYQPKNNNKIISRLICLRNNDASAGQ